MPARIAVIGSCNVDLTTFTDRFPRPGETIFGDHFDLGFGGKGANQAVAARLCGAEVSMIARVGNDLFGAATVRNFESYGIDCREVRVLEGESSGVAPIFVESNGQNRIIVVPGANHRLIPADVDAAAAMLRGASVIVLQLEVPVETVYHAIAFAKANGIRSILNPAPGQPLDAKRASAVDYLIPNETEAEAISGMPVRSTDDARQCAAALQREGYRRVIITLGAAGALLAADGAMELIPGVPVQAKDTTGAGDAFIGSFATFLCEGFSEHDAVASANLYAALSTMKAGTQKSFVTRAELERARAQRAGGAA
jgi:ribokinase